MDQLEQQQEVEWEDVGDQEESEELEELENVQQLPDDNTILTQQDDLNDPNDNVNDNVNNNDNHNNHDNHDNYNNIIEQLTIKNEEQQQQINNLHNQNSILQQQIEQLHFANEDLYGRLQIESDRQQEQNAKLSREFEIQQQSILQTNDSLQFQLNHQQEQNLSVVTEYENKLSLLNQRHQSQINDLNRIVQELKSQLTTMESESINLQQNIHDYDNMAAKYRQCEHDKEELKLKLNTQVTELQQYILKQEEDYSLQFETQNKLIKQLQDKVVEFEAKQQPQSAEKMVTIPVRELMNWDKKSKDQQSQIKAIQAENAQLRNQIDETAKLQNSKQVKSSLSLEGMSQRCQALQQIIDQTSIQNLSLEKQVAQLTQVNVQMKDDLQSAHNELVDLRIIAKDKFKLESDLHQALMQLADHSDQQKQITDLQSHYKTTIDEYENIKKQFKTNEQIRIKLQGKYDDAYEELQKVRKQHNELTQERDIKQLKLKDLEKMLSHQFQEFSLLEQKHKDLLTQSDDMKNQMKIVLRKHQQESDQIKEELIQKQRQISQFEEQSQHMMKDLQVLREHQFRQKSTSEGPVSKKEKIILESLSTRVSELEKELHIQNIKMKELQQQLDSKVAYVNQLAYELSKNYPDLNEADMIDTEDIKLIQQMLNKQNIQQILEKTLVENLQLRDSIKVLGNELNKRS